MKSEISAVQVTRPFSQLLSATPRGARLARLLVVQQLDEWGWPPSCEISESTALVVAELAANAVTHGHVQGRGFRLTLTVEASNTLRIEVADPRGDHQPVACRATSPAAEAGRGLLLIDALSARWGSKPWPPSGKLVWAEIDLPAPPLAASASNRSAPRDGG
ncbi:ATP-binding protein [Streptomyces sp. YU58]|uniref:ATP-binding protein n=1 Tax=Streptomyces sp. SX92 TaxID=3158972 RepID=UPI0027B8BB25|nr:ATP-binding protein [Streptomyces coralus]WLW55523.1 ATP-binding protein [Streptomyces coralus]